MTNLLEQIDINKQKLALLREIKFTSVVERQKTADYIRLLRSDIKKAERWLKQNEN